MEGDYNFDDWEKEPDEEKFNEIKEREAKENEELEKKLHEKYGQYATGKQKKPKPTKYI